MELALSTLDRRFASGDEPWMCSTLDRRLARLEDPKGRPSKLDRRLPDGDPLCGIASFPSILGRRLTGGGISDLVRLCGGGGGDGCVDGCG
jgi:hypothetical protein